MALILTPVPTLWVLFLWVHFSTSSPLPSVYSRPGDVLLGQLIYVNYSDTDGKCNERYSPYRLQNIQEFIYTIDEINKRSDILPNVTLGYTIVNADCHRTDRLLASAFHFLPPGAARNTSAEWGEILDKFHVVGIVAPYLSDTAVKVSGILGHFQIPHISPSADSQELSNKLKYNYFTRVLPSNAFMAQSMIDFLLFYNWTMISVVQSDDSGEFSIASTFLSLARQRGICIGTRGIIDSNRQMDYTMIIKHLKTLLSARAVVLFLLDTQIRILMTEAQKQSVLSHFIWIGTESLNSAIKVYQSTKTFSLNAVLFQNVKGGNTNFDQFLGSLTPEEAASANPWLKALWKWSHQCEWDIASNESKSCYKKGNLVSAKKHVESIYKTYTMDAVYAFAYAVQNLLNEECQHLQLKPDRILKCIKGPKLLAYLKKADFHGYTGRIRFDSNGDVLGGFTLQKYQARGFIPFGKWFRQEGLQMETRKTKWEMKFSKFEKGNGEPHSKCAYPCNPGEFYIQGELKCCWKCQKCRSNEIIMNNASACRACPSLHWPDQKWFTTCEIIPPHYLTWTDPMGISLTSVLVFGILVSTVVITLFVKHRHVKCIKFADRELSVLILFGIILCFATAFSFIMKSTKAVCYVRQIAFHLSFTLLYGPVLAKTSRMYRVFKAAESCKRRIHLISPAAVLMLSFLFVLFQITILVIVILQDTPDIKLQMPIMMEKFVELTCNVTLTSLLAPLSYNVLLVLVSAVFGFLTRKLPDNFNEFLYIFFALITTLIIWVTFIPTYFITQNADHRSLLFIAMLTLNATVFLIGLFSPKLYAVFFVDEKDIMISTLTSDFETQSKTFASSMSTIST